jgi:hypothetical protein
MSQDACGLKWTGVSRDCSKCNRPNIWSARIALFDTEKVLAVLRLDLYNPRLFDS